MEDSLVHIEAHLINVCNNVLILVVMEDSLVLNNRLPNENTEKQS